MFEFESSTYPLAPVLRGEGGGEGSFPTTAVVAIALSRRSPPPSSPPAPAPPPKSSHSHCSDRSNNYVAPPATAAHTHPPSAARSAPGDLRLPPIGTGLPHRRSG